MNQISVILIVFLLLFFGTICFGLYVWWKKSIFTREKFTFTALTAFSIFLIFVLTSIYAQQPPWLAVIGLIKQWQGLPFDPPQALTTEQNILSLILVGAFFYLIIYLHRHWDGAKSKNQYNQEQNQQSLGLIGESWLFLRSVCNPDLLAIYKPDARFSHSALEIANDNLVWHEQAKSLLELSSKSYEFQDGQWHDQQQCWLGRHKHNNNTVLLFCLQKQPEKQQQQRLISYGKKQWKNQDSGDLEIIIALKDGEVDEISQFDLDRYSIRLVSESRLLDNLVDFNDYFREVRKRVEQDKLAESELTLADMYTVSNFMLEKGDEPDANLEAFVNRWLVESSLRQLALLGEYGQGKSTASLMLSYSLICRYQQGDHTARIPILLELRGKSPRTLDANELLAIWAQRYAIDARALLKLMQAGRLLTIFEGFDEVDLSGDSDARIDHFKVLWRLCYPKAKILITGRPNYFLDDTELKCALGINDHSFDRPYCQAVYLLPFGKEEIAHSLRKLDTSTRDDILSLAESNPRFHDIVSRPSMLYVVSVLWQKGELEQYRERINSAIVMDLFIHHNYQRQSAKGKKPNFMPLNSHERAFFMEGIAAYMLVKGLPNQISTQQLDEVMRLLIAAIPDSVSQQADAVGGETRKLLRERFELHLPNKLTEAVDYIKTDVRTCGLLVPDISRSNSFKFGHKSFMEFLAGKVFAQWCLHNELEKTEREIANALVNKLTLTMRDVTGQPEVLDFAAQWIAEKSKNHNEAARLLFELILKAHSPLRIIQGKLLRVAVRCLPYLPTSKFTLIFARFWSRILSEEAFLSAGSIYKSSLLLIYIIIVITFAAYNTNLLIHNPHITTASNIALTIGVVAGVLLSIPILNLCGSSKFIFRLIRRSRQSFVATTSKMAHHLSNS
ncbi:MAG: hypothetical protein PHE96_11460 [Methylococcales bacterium]|nr:hypothetical protein [Methylococcales bacterium]